MADVIIERKNQYVGQRVNLLRDGYGIYCYANKYFRYEGEWKKGRKHGSVILHINLISSLIISPCCTRQVPQPGLHEQKSPNWIYPVATKVR